jgi:[ribosomal protein S18]-alanine N-acetyltransferase
MRLSDIPEVEIIERQSFSSPWSRRAYEYDLAQNALAHYIVIRDRAAGEEAPEETVPVPLTWRERLNAMLRPLAEALGMASPAGPSDGAAETAQPPILGFAGIWMQVDEAHLVTLAVKPACRRTGLGELLLVSVVDLACHLKATSMFLEVRVSNDAAKRLYDKYGFVVARVRKGYYSDNGEDALEMVAEGMDKAPFQPRLSRLKKMLADKLSGY